MIHLRISKGYTFPFITKQTFRVAATGNKDQTAKSDFNRNVYKNASHCVKIGLQFEYKKG